mgnify:CR=1 FL=1
MHACMHICIAVQLERAARKASTFRPRSRKAHRSLPPSTHIMKAGYLSLCSRGSDNQVSFCYLEALLIADVYGDDYILYSNVLSTTPRIKKW